MIPMIAIIHVRTHGNFRMRLWLPLILVWVLLAPVVILVMPLAIVAAVVWTINPFPLIAGLWRLISATRGVRVHVDTPGALVQVHII
jgi:hypothetical protein